MSIVLNVLCESVSWIAFDGRATRNGTIVTESQEKAVLINPFVAVGYTGILEVASNVIHILRNHVRNVQNMPSDVVAEVIQQLLATSNESENPSTSFLISGINRDHCMATYTLGTRHELQAITPNKKGSLHVTHLHSEKNTIDPIPYMKQRICQTGLSQKAILDIMRQYIIDVSKVDSSVNTFVRFIKISR